MARAMLRCLGTGDHESCVYGTASTSFLLFFDEKPALLVGCGNGTIAAAASSHAELPPRVLLLTATLSHTQEISAYVARVVALERRKLQIFTPRPTSDAISSLLQLQLQDQRLDWDHVEVVVVPMDRAVYPMTEDLSVAMAEHTHAGGFHRRYVTGAAVIFSGGSPLISFGGPWPLRPPTAAWIAASPYVVVWTTEKGGHGTAVNDVEEWLASIESTPHVMLCGYGTESRAPIVSEGVRFTILREKTTLALIRSPTDHRIGPPPIEPPPSQHHIPSHRKAGRKGQGGNDSDDVGKRNHAANDDAARGEGDSPPPTVDARRVVVVSHDDPTRPPAVVALRRVRGVAQLADIASELLGARPVGSLRRPSGAIVESTDDLKDKDTIVLVRRGGKPFHPQGKTKAWQR